MVYPIPETPIKTIGLREICTVDGHHFKRLRGTEKWTEYTPEHTSIASTTTTPEDRTAGQQSPLYLSLILEHQDPGSPKHWSLFLSHENSPGDIFAVTGDAECMHYSFSESPINLTLSEAFANIYHLAEIAQDQVGIVREVARGEDPPKAKDRASVRENCQGWVVRVLEGLSGRGIVAREKVGMVSRMLEPV
ncbi:uncharacterized protein BDV14DRAFT_198244 [Aspergillus stella-maris]|uniref:uncharacterized protein n=1 Tax=Aspergillus stella-maris TaxID=1810926 RepID=UPI003CCDA9B6